MKTAPKSSDARAFSIDRRNGALVVTVTCDRIDHGNSGTIQRAVTAAAIEPPRLPVIIDLSAVGFVPSPAQGMLVEIRNLFQQTGQRLILAGLQEKVASTFALARLNKVFEISKDLETAIQSVQKASGRQFREC